MSRDTLLPMSEATAAVDRINRRAMQGSVSEYDAIVGEGLNSQERAALELVREDVAGGRILDLGVGAGRTVAPLLAVSEQYVGVDYMPEMVEHCRKQFRGVRFERMDARVLDAFPAESFDLVFFSCNGICMVDHAGRLAILSEVQRVLAPGGAFIFSTCNRNSSQYEAVFRFPTFAATRNPLKWVPRAARFLRQTLVRARNRLRLRAHEIRTPEYAMLNDVCHHYSTMLYFIDLQSQLKQLERAGLAHGVFVFDLAGRPTDGACRDGTLTFVTRKPAAPR